MATVSKENIGQLHEKLTVKLEKTDYLPTFEKALKELQDARSSEDLTRIEKALEELNTVWNAASQDIYNASQQAGNAGGGEPQANATTEEPVSDVEFEEVKDNK